MGSEYRCAVTAIATSSRRATAQSRLKSRNAEMPMKIHKTASDVWRTREEMIPVPGSP